MNNIGQYLPYLNKLEKEMEKARDLSQVIVHVDMDGKLTFKSKT